MCAIKPKITIWATDISLLAQYLEPKEAFDMLLALQDLCLLGRTKYKPETDEQKICWDKLKADFDKDLACYQAAVENGKKGGRPKKNTSVKNPEQNPDNNPEYNPDNNPEQKLNITQSKNSLSTVYMSNRLLSNNPPLYNIPPEGEEPTKGTHQKKFIPPDVDEVMAYCRERNNNVDAERFVDFYASKGWMVGKTKMKDWKAAVRNWEKSTTVANNNDKDKCWF